MSGSEKEEEKKVDGPKVPYFQLFRYATGLDKALVVVSLLCSLFVGLAQPAMMIVFGDMTGK